MASSYSRIIVRWSQKPEVGRGETWAGTLAAPDDTATCNPLKVSVAPGEGWPSFAASEKTGAHWFRLLVRYACCMPGKSVILVINPGKKTNANYDEELALAA